MSVTRVHLLRHGEVYNPAGVLYGRLPGYHLSDLGRAMADRVAETVADRDITVVTTSPLERAIETGAPVAESLGVEPGIDERLIEADNVFEGLTFGVGDGSLKRPALWKHLWNPFRPSWGEPYEQLATRMRGALDAARIQAEGHEALLVSHQLPIWTVRSAVEGRRLWHDPRKRECALASLTTFEYRGADVDRSDSTDDTDSQYEIVSVAYSEPAADLVPTNAGPTFSAGA